MLVFGTKSDLKKSRVVGQEAQEFATKIGAAYFEASSRTDMWERIDEVWRELAWRIFYAQLNPGCVFRTDIDYRLMKIPGSPTILQSVEENMFWLWWMLHNGCRGFVIPVELLLIIWRYMKDSVVAVQRPKTIQVMREELHT